MAKKPNKKSTWSDIDGGMAFVIPVTLIRHENYKLLSAWAHKLIADLSRQYTGYNNGYLCAAWSVMRSQGWNSPTTLRKTMLELEHYGFLFRTQQGGRNKPNLHAFTWRRINEIPGKSLEVGPTIQPQNHWKREQPPFYPRTDKPEGGANIARLGLAR